jgi:hypothetical protein
VAVVAGAGEAGAEDDAGAGFGCGLGGWGSWSGEEFGVVAGEGMGLDRLWW